MRDLGCIEIDLDRDRARDCDNWTQRLEPPAKGQQCVRAVVIDVDRR